MTTIVFSLVNAMTFLLVLTVIVPKFKQSNLKKHSMVLFAFTILSLIYDASNFWHVIFFYGFFMIVLRVVYANSSFVSGLSILFLYIIHLLGSLITSNLVVLIFEMPIDFRYVLKAQSFVVLLFFLVVLFFLTQYYKSVIKVFQRVNHLNRKLERLLILSNIIVFSVILAYHRMAFSNLISIAQTGVLGLAKGNNTCFYMLASYMLTTLLSFIVVVLINRLFIVDFSMENYKFKAETDLMTGALSREAGLAHLKNEMIQSAMQGTKLTIAYIDINDLKKVNDVQGHKAGDLMIKTITNIIGENLRGKDEIARLGGDEFMIVFKRCTLDQAARVWMRIGEAFLRINQQNVHTFNLSASVGFVEYDPLKHKDMMQLLHEADENMYAYKKRLKSRVL